MPKSRLWNKLFNSIVSKQAKEPSDDETSVTITNNFADVQLTSELRAVLQSERILLTDKVVKVNRKMWKQSRIFIITNMALYNFSVGNFSDSNRRIAFDEIRQLFTVEGSTEELVIHCKSEHDYRFQTTHRTEFTQTIIEAAVSSRNQRIHVIDLPISEILSLMSFNKTRKNSATLSDINTSFDSDRSPSLGPTRKASIVGDDRFSMAALNISKISADDLPRLVQVFCAKLISTSTSDPIEFQEAKKKATLLIRQTRESTHEEFAKLVSGLLLDDAIYDYVEYKLGQGKQSRRGSINFVDDNDLPSPAVMSLERMESTYDTPTTSPATIPLKPDNSELIVDVISSMLFGLNDVVRCIGAVLACCHIDRSKSKRSISNLTRVTISDSFNLPMMADKQTYDGISIFMLGCHKKLLTSTVTQILSSSIAMGTNIMRPQFLVLAMSVASECSNRLQTRDMLKDLNLLLLSKSSDNCNICRVHNPLWKTQMFQFLCSIPKDAAARNTIDEECFRLSMNVFSLISVNLFKGVSEIDSESKSGPNLILPPPPAPPASLSPRPRMLTKTPSSTALFGRPSKQSTEEAVQSCPISFEERKFVFPPPPMDNSSSVTLYSGFYDLLKDITGSHGWCHSSAHVMRTVFSAVISSISRPQNLMVWRNNLEKQEWVSLAELGTAVMNFMFFTPYNEAATDGKDHDSYVLNRGYPDGARNSSLLSSFNRSMERDSESKQKFDDDNCDSIGIHIDKTSGALEDVPLAQKMIKMLTDLKMDDRDPNESSQLQQRLVIAKRMAVAFGAFDSLFSKMQSSPTNTSTEEVDSCWTDVAMMIYQPFQVNQNDFVKGKSKKRGSALWSNLKLSLNGIGNSQKIAKKLVANIAKQRAEKLVREKLNVNSLDRENSAVPESQETRTLTKDKRVNESVRSLEAKTVRHEERQEMTREKMAALDELDQILGDSSVELVSVFCKSCQKPILGGISAAISELGAHFHVSCITCSVCSCQLLKPSESLADPPKGKYFVRGQKIFCTRHYLTEFGEGLCSGCFGYISPADTVIHLGTFTWHVDHFSCHGCDRILSKDESGEFYWHLERPYCQACFLYTICICNRCKQLTANLVDEADQTRSFLDYGGIDQQNVAFSTMSKTVSQKKTHGVIVSDQVFHFDCVSCVECNVNLLDLHSEIYMDPYEPRNGLLYCQEHWRKKFLPKCQACKELVDDGIQACGGAWHENCFRCKDCDLLLTSNILNGKFIEHGGSPYCEACHKRLFSKKCYECGREIIGEFAEVKDPVTKLNRCYHQSCFQCCECSMLFSDTKEVYLIGPDSKIYCQKDYDIVFSNLCSICSLFITSGVIVDVGKYHFHENCLKCNVCGLVLCSSDKEVGFIGRLIEFGSGSLQPLCQPHHEQLINVTAPKCVACLKPIVRASDAYGVGEDEMVHSSCLRCTECSIPLVNISNDETKSGASFISPSVCSSQDAKSMSSCYRDPLNPSRFFCQEHFSLLVAPICFGCRLPITNTCVTVDMTMAGDVQAGEKRRYHSHCAVCFNCNAIVVGKKADAAGKYLMLRMGLLSCQDCGRITAVDLSEEGKKKLVEMLDGDLSMIAEKKPISKPIAPPQRARRPILTAIDDNDEETDRIDKAYEKIIN